MNDILNPPSERDLPPGRSERMRADLLTVIGGPRPRAGRRLVLVAATVAVVAAGSAVSGLLRDRAVDGPSRVLAMSVSEMTPELRNAATYCLDHATGAKAKPAMTDLAVAAQRDHRAAVMFLSEAGYLACDVTMEPGKEISSGISESDWRSGEWMPGAVERALLTSTEADGGDVTVLGRVSNRVARLVLEHGDGKNTTNARITDGAFGLMTDGGSVNDRALLIAYDAGGAEIGRRPLFKPLDRDGRCFTDPSGKQVYGKDKTKQCLPAQRWDR
jgi:hypothetical protein